MRRVRLPHSVVAATVVMGCLVILWTVAVPAYRIVDEPQWLSTAVRMAEGHGYPPPGQARLEHAVVATYPYAGFAGSDDRTFVPRAKVDGRPPGWPSLKALGDAPADQVQLTRPDQMTQHPPLWALLAAGELRVLHLLDLPADNALAVLRLLQGLLLLPLPWLVWATARRIGATVSASAAAAWLPVGVPQLLHIGSGVSDTALLVLELAAATPLLAGAATGDRRRRVAAALGALFAAAMLTKLFALLLLPAIAVAYLAGARGRLRPALARAAAATGIAVGAAGWWYVLSLVRHGSIQPSGYPAEVLGRFAMDMSAMDAVQRFGSQLLRSWWSDLGWFETPAPVWVCVALTAVVVGPLVALVVRRSTRLTAAVMLTPAMLLLLAVCYAGLSSYLRLHAIYGVQGRYLFPAAVGVAAVLALALDLAPGWLHRAVPIVPLVTQGLGLLLATQHFWSPSGARLGALHSALTRSVLPTWLLATVALAALVAIAVAVAAPGTGLPQRAARYRQVPREMLARPRSRRVGAHFAGSFAHTPVAPVPVLADDIRPVSGVTSGAEPAGDVRGRGTRG